MNVKTTVSVIIPTFNEKSTIGKTIKSIKSDNQSTEVIVSDGGSRDNTTGIAKAYGALIVESPRGRGTQMDKGAEIAKGDILLFLHSDTVLPQNWEDLIVDALKADNIVGGAFSFKTDGIGFKYRILEKLVALRNKSVKLIYGDQAIFVNKAAFKAVGGFNSLPLMEDIDLVKRLRQTGKFIVLPDEAITSSRRWQKHGFIRTSIRNLFYIFLYYIGIKPESIYKRYYK